MVFYLYIHGLLYIAGHGHYNNIKCSYKDKIKYCGYVGGDCRLLMGIVTYTGIMVIVGAAK